jgi:choline dehydrogenase-like flavoprotein
LVIEYGDFDDSLSVQIPFYASRMQTPDLFFLTSVPQTELNNRTSSLALGATVGGGSTVNGMAWDRGSAAEYDAWEKLGNPGWGWDGLRKYFKKVCDHQPCHVRR